MAGNVERLTNVENQLQQTYDTLIKAQNDLAEAQAANSNMQHELEGLRNISAAASKSDEQLAALQNELGEVRSEKTSLATQLAQSQASIHDLQQKVNELEGIVKSQMNEKCSLEQQLQNLQEMTQENMEGSYELQANLETTMEELTKTQAQLRTEQEKCASLQQSLDETKQSSISREELDRAQNEITSLQQQIRHFHDLEQSLNQQLQEAERAKDAIVTQLQAAHAERVAAVEEQQKMKVCYEQAAAQLAAAQSSTNELQHANDDLSHSLEQTRAKAMQAEQQINAMRVEHSEAQKQVETLTKKNLGLVSEIQNMRDEADKQQQMARGQLEQLKTAHADIQRQLAEATQALHSKDAAVAAAAQRNQADVAQLEDLINRYKTDKQSSDQQLAQLNAECERLRQAHDEAKTTVDRSQRELEQIRAHLSATQQEKASLEAEIGQLRGLNDEKVHLLQEVDEQKRVNQRLEETNRELEGLLQKSKAYCEELSRDSEDKISRVQEFARHVEQEARDEIDRVAHENGVLRDELEQLAQVRFEETTAHDELNVKLAELQAENNVLSARAHRLTQQLSQYTDLPEDDELAAAGQGQTPDLWELLSSGMEQLKADLELASKYAASIDASSVDGGIGDESFTVAN
ncbi:Myosin-like protein [Phytophthora palmivora]|uniref:Myosin-like protein n=1 Tax=Phytophthora palmivora TaxID=4796 RepID=A0A2P4YI22_9STRA|nr:Myosin-like protein [Phytophthora palmivora]